MTDQVQSRYGISTLTRIGQPLETALQRLAEAGWRRLEIMVEDGHRELLDWSEERLGELERWGERQGIAWSMHAPIHGVNSCSSDPSEVEAGLALLKRAIAIANRLGASYVVMHPGEYDRPIPDPASDPNGYAEARADCVARCASYLRRLIGETGGEEGNPLALENVPPRPDRFGWDCAFLADAIAASGTSRVRILFDIGHAHLCGEGHVMNELRKHERLLLGMHISDNRGMKDEHLAVGRGTIPYEGIVAALGKAGDRIAWVLETGSEAAASESLELLDNWRTLHSARGRAKEE
ncbi:sugar phosphate isomerase/epimerase family protein [Cohnella fermenti]|uniref:Sugar phosphate isomerase/epimerase n=1 Tax=Cohnella fermenti TaxID=2565925 RepID=A0A4S4BMK7_9BACL|nr:sugar phosphate isomerase/epimerase family protein [Cohnella fermenti]THF75495.1 sugar phosphate isomerase/epimerase [Cohnella fermenti]